MNAIKSAIYSTLDAVTLGRGIKRNIGGHSIKFPAKFSRYYESDYEPDTFRFFEKHIKPGMTVLDIGAHIGLFAVLLGELVEKDGKVFSFEPTPFTRSVLEEVVRINGLSEIVEVRGEALSKEKGKAIFYDTGSEVSNANSLVKSERGTSEIEIEMTSVDNFVDENKLSVDCMKIDVEGAELDVLVGARNTIAGFRPVIRLGLHPPFINDNKQTLQEIWDLLSEYELDVFFENKPVNRDWFCKQPNLFDVDLIPS